MFDPFLSDYRPDNSRVSAAVFGEIGGQKSLADLQDFLASVRYRMQQMASALGQIDPSRVKDAKAFAALMVDAGNLKTRVTRADANASALLSANVLPLAYVPAQSAYNTLLKAIKQGAPPDGAQIQRGDLDDVINRIGQMGGKKVDLSQMPQPRAPDPDRGFMNATDPLARAEGDALARAKAIIDALKREGEEERKKLDWMEGLYRFAKEYEKELFVVGVIAGGALLWHMAPHVLPAAKMAGKALILA